MSIKIWVSKENSLTKLIRFLDFLYSGVFETGDLGDDNYEYKNFDGHTQSFFNFAEGEPNHHKSTSFPLNSFVLTDLLRKSRKFSCQPKNRLQMA